MIIDKNKHVFIFDFDETLCFSEYKVKIYDNKELFGFELTPTDYSSWREDGFYDTDPSRWDMDFSDFVGYPHNSKPNKRLLSLLKVLLLKPTDDICILVTGRDELSGPKKWLKDNGIDIDSMFFMCSGGPNKTNCFESIVNTFIPKKISIYEDAFSYINQCKKVCSKYSIKFESHLIEGNAV